MLKMLIPQGFEEEAPTGKSMLETRKKNRISIRPLIAAGVVLFSLAACNKAPHQNAADYQSQVSHQEFTREMQESAHAHELAMAAINEKKVYRQQDLDAATARKGLELNAQTERLADQHNAEARRRVGIAAVIGCTVAAIGFCAYLGWRHFVFHAALTRRMVVAEQERTDRCGEVIAYLKSPQCDLPTQDRVSLIESTVAVANQPLLPGGSKS